ncbi:unnamed protein product [Somion occarium]|uniref:C2H2-type domain-containing protein n=1 Tax=Somion occarium TaxID=3059160 RepID=A0ABP1DNL5_9APHY
MPAHRSKKPVKERTIAGKTHCCGPRQFTDPRTDGHDYTVTCMICKEICNDSQTALRHLRAYMNGRSLGCFWPDCDRYHVPLANIDCLIVHYRGHAKIYDHCRHCDLYFSHDPSLLSRHEKNRHPKEYQSKLVIRKAHGTPIKSSRKSSRKSSGPSRSPSAVPSETPSIDSGYYSAYSSQASSSSTTLDGTWEGVPSFLRESSVDTPSFPDAPVFPTPDLLADPPIIEPEAFYAPTLYSMSRLHSPPPSDTYSGHGFAEEPFYDSSQTDSVFLNFDSEFEFGGNPAFYPSFSPQSSYAALDAYDDLSYRGAETFTWPSFPPPYGGF